MQIDKQQAQDLVDAVVNQLLTWPRLQDVAFQLGGWEEKTAPQIMSAMEAWGANHHPDYCPLREYRKIDIAFVDVTGEHARLPVSTLIEIKFNFAAQILGGKPMQIPGVRRPVNTGAEGRLRQALRQLGKYLLDVQGPKQGQKPDPYILYVVVDQTRPRMSVPSPPCDAGWKHLNGITTGTSSAADVTATMNAACVRVGLEHPLAHNMTQFPAGGYSSHLCAFLIEVLPQTAIKAYNSGKKSVPGQGF